MSDIFKIYEAEDIKAIKDAVKLIRATKQNRFKLPGGINDEYYIKQVLYNDPIVKVWFSDNTSTISKKAPQDQFDPQVGLAICILKKILGASKVREIMEAWQPEEGQKYVDLNKVRYRENHPTIVDLKLEDNTKEDYHNDYFDIVERGDNLKYNGR